MDVLYQFGSLDFVWDVHKAAANVAKHGVRFEQACEVVSIPWCGSWMPARWMRRGTVSSAKPIRIISARIATATERKNYEEYA